MVSRYIEYRFTVLPQNPGQDILIAQLAENGFESFMEEEEEILAYIPVAQDIEDIRSSIAILQNPDYTIAYTQKEIREKDWNAQWESEFKPIQIDGNCVVRASFHPPSKALYDLVINPKMAFGTGHHQTTFLMIKHLLELDVKGKTILDMGCGTGVLSILAKKRGAQSIDAIDIDPRCYENTIENSITNNCKAIHAFEGDSTLLKEQQYDLILANINRNILLKDIQNYTRCLLKSGTLLMSGFYEGDLEMIKEESQNNGLTYISHKTKDNWVAAQFKKS